MSFFDIIDRRQPKPEKPKPEPQMMQMPRLSLDDLENLPDDYDPRNPIAELQEETMAEAKALAPARKKPGRPPKAKP